MCKYCETAFDEYFPSLGCHGATIVSDCAAECEIVKVEEEYYIKLWADEIKLSAEPIKFCPFCCRKLND